MKLRAMGIREVNCDHAIERPKLHPIREHVNIGNLIIGMCGTCYNALRGQILGNDLEKLITLQTTPPMQLSVSKRPNPNKTRMIH